MTRHTRKPRVQFLEDRTVPALVQGTVFDDANRNQVFDAGDSGLSGWTAYLDVNRNDLLDSGEPSAITDGAGEYTLDTTGVTGQWHIATLDLQVGTGGRWLDSSASQLSVDSLNGRGGANLGVYFEPYTSVQPDGPESAINTTTAGVQDSSTVAADASGNYAIVWRSIPAGGNQSVMARVFNADGSPRTGEISVVTGGYVELPYVDMADNGRLAVAWASSSGANPSNVFTRVYNANGTAATGVITVATARSNNYNFIHGVGMDADGDFAVLYTSTHPRLTVKLQRYTAAGAVNGKVIEIAQPALFNGRNHIGMDDAGNFLVVWENVRLYAQRYGTNGKPTGAQIGVANGGNGIGYTNAAMNSSGQWAVSWTVFPGSGGIYLQRVQRFQANGTPAGLPVDVSATVGGLTIDDAGTVTMSRTDAHGEVRFRRFIGGATLEQEYVVNTTTAGSQKSETYNNYPQYSNGLAATGIDRFVVPWQGYGPGDNSGVFAQRYALPPAPMAPPQSSGNDGDEAIEMFDLGLHDRLDADGDGVIDIADFGQFSVRYFTALP